MVTTCKRSGVPHAGLEMMTTCTPGNVYCMQTWKWLPLESMQKVITHRDLEMLTCADLEMVTCAEQANCYHTQTWKQLQTENLQMVTIRRLGNGYHM